jgi:hypothetical protein
VALTDFQRRVCRLIAQTRIASGESYVAGGVALNELAAGARVSRDIDLFHDTETAVDHAWRADRALLEREGLLVRPIRQLPSLVEAVVSDVSDSVRVEWARDSSYRFFPLVTHAVLGLTLHPVDLATNKVLALVGRLEVRDWIDVITIDDRIQPLGYLAWAASGKDPGVSPSAILEHAARTSRYSQEEVAQLAFDGRPPDAASLSQAWHRALEEAREVVLALPAAHVGTCVLTRDFELCRAGASDLPELVASDALVFHRGSMRGAFPRIIG